MSKTLTYTLGAVIGQGLKIQLMRAVDNCPCKPGHVALACGDKCHTAGEHVCGPCECDCHA